MRLVDVGAIAGSGGAVDPKAYAGATEAWLMNEASGNIVGAILSTSVTDQAGNTYSVAGGDWTPGITTVAAGGFANSSHISALDPGTDDFNIFYAMTYSSFTGTQRIYGTTNIAIGQPGFSVYSNGSALVLEMLADDTTTQASASWSTAENAVLAAAVADTTSVHTYEFRVNRATNLVYLFVDDTAPTYPTIDISAMGTTNITGYRVAIGQEVRGSGIGVGVKGTIYFVRQTNGSTVYPP